MTPRPSSKRPLDPQINTADLQDRRGRRIVHACRMFFFGDDNFEGEATVLDVSTIRLQGRVMGRSQARDGVEAVAVPFGF